MGVTLTPRRLRVSFIAPFGMKSKGTVRARMVPMAQALARRGHSVQIVVPPWDDPQPPTRMQKRDITPQGAPGSVALEILPANVPYRAPQLLAGLITRSQLSFRPDVTHIFKPLGYSALTAFALTALRVPWVLDVDDWEGSGGWADVNPYSMPQRLAITASEALLPRLSGSITAASRTLVARAWNSGLSKVRVFYVPNGVTAEKYGSWPATGALHSDTLRARLGLGVSPVILLYTRFAEFPLTWPLQVLRAALREHPEAHLLVVGGGFFHEEERLVAAAKEMGIARNVMVTGTVSEDHLPAYLAIGDVAIYPMADTLLNRAKSPAKVLEPMLMGIPIVAHRVGQAAAFIGDAGTLIIPGDIDSMAAAVTALLHDEMERERIGTRARKRVWERFNWDDLSGVVEGAYSAALTRA